MLWGHGRSCWAGRWVQVGARAGGLEDVHELHTRHPRPQLPLKLSHGATVTFICAQNWGVFVKDPSHLAEQFILAKCLQESKGFLWAPRQT